MPDKHHRRSIRLGGYDYAQPGAHFVTICTRDHACLFGHVVNGEMHLNEAGEIAQRCWEDIPAHFPLVELDAFVIMPNHVHGIIIITDTPTTPANTTLQRRGESCIRPGDSTNPIRAITRIAPTERRRDHWVVFYRPSNPGRPMNTLWASGIGG